MGWGGAGVSFLPHQASHHSLLSFGLQIASTEPLWNMKCQALSWCLFQGCFPKWGSNHLNSIGIHRRTIWDGPKIFESQRMLSQFEFPKWRVSFSSSFISTKFGKTRVHLPKKYCCVKLCPSCTLHQGVGRLPGPSWAWLRHGNWPMALHRQRSCYHLVPVASATFFFR